MATDFTIADVLAFARSKPADEWYNYEKPSNCAMCQFLNETGRTQRASVVMNSWCETGIGTAYKGGTFSGEIHRALIGSAAGGDGWRQREWRWGRLAERLARHIPAPVTSDTWTKADAYLIDIEQVENA